MRKFIKKIIYVCLLFFALGSCSIAEVEDTMPNPVLGVWNNYFEDTDSLVMTRVFTKDFYSYFTFAEGKIQNEMNKQEYLVNEMYLELDNYTQRFEIKVDTLWITNSKGDQVTKYIRVD